MYSRDSSKTPTSSRAVDLLTGSALLIATVSFVLWQNLHLTVLWDLSYILENATRISLGQLPYRDFPFPYAPLTFLVQAAIIKLFGAAVFHHYLYSAVTAATVTVLTWSILLRLLSDSPLPARLIAFLLSVPLIFLGTGSIFPLPFYDSDCTLFVLFCIWLLLHLERAQFPPISTFICGVFLVVPLFIKQNTGLAFLLSAVVCIVWLGVRGHLRTTALLLAGISAGLVSALALIQYTVGLASYLHWTIQFAASRRLPGFATMLGIYRDSSLGWMFVVYAVGLALFFLPSTIVRRKRRLTYWIAVALMALPFLWAAAELVLQEDASDRVEALLHIWPVLLVSSFLFALWRLPRAVTFRELLPFVLLGTVHGAFLSQQLWGSTYALWPLLMLLLATLPIALASQVPDADSTLSQPLTAFAALASLMLLITGAYYALSHERLDYVDLSGDRLFHSNLPALRGLAMRGNWLPDFEELVTYSNREIPRTDAILMIPGEDLFYFTTGRVPQFPVVMMDNTVNPYSAQQIVEYAQQRNVQWLVVKRNLQLQEQPLAFRPQLLELLSHDFSLVESLNNYDVYRRNQN